MAERVHKYRTRLSRSYMALGDDWAEYVNAPMKTGELQKIRNSVSRQAPLGDEKWQVDTTTKYGMLSTLNKRGRPKKYKK